MNAKFFLVVALFIVVVGGGGVAWRAQQSAVDAGNERAALAVRRASLDADVLKLEKRTEEVESKRVDLQATIAKLGTAKPTAAAAPPVKKPPGATAMPNPMDLIAKDPKLQLLYLGSQRATIAIKYGPLFHSLSLVPAQVEKVRDAMIRAVEREQDLMAMVHERKFARDDPAVVAMQKQTREDLLAAEAEVLGPAGMETLQQYERAAPAREMVGRFAGIAALADVPLAAPQVELLMQFVAEAGRSAAVGGPGDGVDFDWTEVAAQRPEILSAGQIALLKRVGPAISGAVEKRFGQAMGEALKSMPAPVKSPGG